MSSVLIASRFLGPTRKLVSDRGIAGVAAVVLLLAGTRWGSYIGGGGIFLTDFLIAGAIVHYILTIWIKPKALPFVEYVPGSRPTLLVLLLGFVGLRFFLGQQWTVLAVRDAMPYFYTAVGILAWVATSRSTVEQCKRTTRLFVWALGFHAAWFFVVSVIWPGLPTVMPSVSFQQSLHLFTPRNDIDTALVGVYSGYLLFRVIRGVSRRSGCYILGFLLCWVSIFFTGSRAGLIGALIAVGFSFFSGMRGKNVSSNSRLIVLASLPLILGAFIFIAPQTEVGIRLISSIGLAEQSSKITADADGTQRARANAWDRMIEWTLEDSSRTVVGSGFGDSILSESGSDLLLIGASEVGETVPRSPHNYWVGSFARTGTIGVGLLLLISAGHIRRTLKRPKRAGHDEFQFLVGIVPLAIIVPATLGVVLESPFGAVPFFWCIGALLALDRNPASGAFDPQNRPLQGSATPSGANGAERGSSELRV